MDSLAKKITDAIGKYHTKFMQNKVLKTIEEIEATTDPLSKYIAGAETVDELNNKLMLKLPDDIQISAEGSGADVKYYAQLGADAASKKRLGAELVTKTISISAKQTITLTTDNDITMACLASVENRAFQATYDKINGSYSGYGDCTISASGNTLTIATGGGPSGRWRISYC